jgi:hypothetical protein
MVIVLRSDERNPMTATPPNPKLSQLAPLLGKWKLEAFVDGSPVMRGTSTLEWAEHGPFLIQRADGAATDDAPQGWHDNLPFPTFSTIGFDEGFGGYSVLYSDARGVLRIYEMSFDAGVWTQWRDAPGFHQRFIGTLDDDGSRIDARWDASPDGQEWSLDFELIYTRIA